MPYSKTTDSELDAAYKATAYTVHLIGGDLVIRVGQFNFRLEQMLTFSKCKTWAFLSACNPKSRQYTASENELRHQQLKEVACANGFVMDKTLFEGLGIPNSGDWLPEASWLILGITKKDASIWALNFEQHAFLFGERGDSPQLIYVT